MERVGAAIPLDVAESLLNWWNEAGVDVMVDESPRNWLRPRKIEPAIVEPVPDSRLARVQPDAFPDQLDLFQAYLRESDALPFATPSSPRVCPAGDPASGLMIMTDMPALEDCGAGTLISGDAGRLFDRMLSAIGKSRETVYLASLSCIRSPDGLLSSDAGKCATLARHHIGLVAPKALLIFGDECSKALTGLSVMQARGRWHDIQTHAGAIKAIVTFSPSFLLDQPAAKPRAWADLQMLMQGYS